MAFILKAYALARKWLSEIYLSVIFDRKSFPQDSPVLWKEFLSLLEEVFFIKTNGEIESLIKKINEAWDKEAPYPSGIPTFELMTELAVSRSPVMTELKVSKRKEIGKYLLAHSHAMEELFVAVGLNHPQIQHRFRFDTDALPWKIIEQKRLKRQFKSSLLLQFFKPVVYALGLTLAFSKEGFSKNQTASFTLVGIGLLALAGTGVALYEGDFISPNANLQWKLKPKLSVNLSKAGWVQIREVGQKTTRSYEKSLVSFIVSNTSGKSADLTAEFKTFFTTEGAEVPTLYRVFHGDFKMDSAGKMEVAAGESQPSIRSYPSFPNRILKPGDTWDAALELFYHDAAVPFSITPTAHYLYLSNSTFENKNVAMISIVYTYEENLTKRVAATSTDSIGQLSLSNDSLLYWNVADGLPVYQTEFQLERWITIQNRRIEFRMDYRTRFDATLPLEEKELKKMATDVKNLNQDRSKLDASVEADGLHIRLGDILFQTDSSRLSEESKQILGGLAPLLSKYQDYELLVTGHADAVGNADYNQKLSTKRAESVAGFLCASNQNSKTYVIGAGSSQPIADNKSEAGRQKNRRVEIIVKQSGHLLKENSTDKP